MLKKLLSLLALTLLFAGCSTVTNLTPAQLPRNASGLYLFEAAWDTREQALRPGTIEPKIMVGENFIPMQQTRLLPNRWEALVPIPSDKEAIHYRYKFDYQVNAISAPRSNSVLSPEFKLRIIEK